MRPENDEYQLRFAVPARLNAPVGFIGVQCDEDGIIGASYLPKSMRELPPQNYLAREAAKQLRAYFAKPRTHKFDLPLHPAPTIAQRKARDILLLILPGKALTYSQLARAMKSSPRGAGSVCRANRVTLIVPCHRIVASGGIGGFGGGGDDMINVKRWFLNYEGYENARWTTKS